VAAAVLVHATLLALVAVGRSTLALTLTPETPES
jgi:hypothetical protein